LVRNEIMMDLSIPLPPSKSPLTRRWMTRRLPKVILVMSEDSFPSLQHPFKVPRAAKMPTKRPAVNEENNNDRQVKKAMISMPNPKPGMPADKGRMDLIYLDAKGRGKDFIPLMAGNLLGHTFPFLPPGYINWRATKRRRHTLRTRGSPKSSSPQIH
jgi:hypothetical protein